ncbi:MAG: WbqC family protein [Flammeovirgaceae bacterium]|nr:MAG: WbqC family protein [Flammeovirgaceae bacterium]
MPAKRCLIELHYLPSLAWFAAVSGYDEVIIEKHEHYVKQTYRNRCYIRGANRVEKLIIPLTSKSNHTRIADLRIDYSQKWLNNHWRSIESAYRNAPYFDHYADDLSHALFSGTSFLYELNNRLLEVCLKLLNLKVTLKESSQYEKTVQPGTHDLRNQISPKHSGLEKFIKPVAYTQVFGNTFMPNLSIIDLLFCTGPESLAYIKTARISE